MDDAPRDRAYFRGARVEARLWLALLAGPLAWALGLALDYGLVRVACAEGDSLPLHLVTVVTLALAAGGGTLAWREWGRAGRVRPGEGSDELARTRFMAAIGVAAAVLFATTILGQWVAKLFLGPCMAI